MNFENIIIGHITLSMLVAFTLGIACLFVYAWKTSAEQLQGYSTKRYMRLTLPNVVFHFVASLLVFWILHEISEIIIQNFIPALNGNSLYHNTLSALTGMFGSVLVAKVFEIARKKQNTIDSNIKHVHDEHCNH